MVSHTILIIFFNIWHRQNPKADQRKFSGATTSNLLSSLTSSSKSLAILTWLLKKHLRFATPQLLSTSHNFMARNLRLKVICQSLQSTTCFESVALFLKNAGFVESDFIKALGSFTQRQQQSKVVKNHLCVLKLNEFAPSMPSMKC